MNGAADSNGIARSVPMATLERLSVYLNCLIFWEQDGVETVSSAILQARTGISAQQVRKDLSYFGEFGRRGKGYSVARLREEICHILKLNEDQPVALVGAGHLGTALLAFPGWQPYKFRIAAVFDVAESKIGRRMRGLEVLPLDRLGEVIGMLGARIGIIAVPPECAQDVAHAMVQAGIQVILNFAPTTVRADGGVAVRNVCFMSELAVLSYLARDRSPPL